VACLFHVISETKFTRKLSENIATEKNNLHDVRHTSTLDARRLKEALHEIK